MPKLINRMYGRTMGAETIPCGPDSPMGQKMSRVKPGASDTWVKEYLEGLGFNTIWVQVLMLKRKAVGFWQMFIDACPPERMAFMKEAIREWGVDPEDFDTLNSITPALRDTQFAFENPSKTPWDLVDSLHREMLNRGMPEDRRAWIKQYLGDAKFHMTPSGYRDYIRGQQTRAASMIKTEARHLRDIAEETPAEAAIMERIEARKEEIERESAGAAVNYTGVVAIGAAVVTGIVLMRRKG